MKRFSCLYDKKVKPDYSRVIIQIRRTNARKISVELRMKEGEKPQFKAGFVLIRAVLGRKSFLALNRAGCCSHAREGVVIDCGNSRLSPRRGRYVLYRPLRGLGREGTSRSPA
jgi:hypothetical protein